MTVILMTLVLLVIQTTVLSMYVTVAPDLALIAALYCGRRFGKKGGYKLGVIVGLAQDLFTHGVLGLNMLSKGLIGMSSGMVRESNLFDPRAMKTWVVVIVGYTVLNELLWQIYSTSLFDFGPSLSSLVGRLFTQSALNLAAGLPLIYAMDRMTHWYKSMEEISVRP